MDFLAYAASNNKTSIVSKISGATGLVFGKGDSTPTVSWKLAKLDRRMISNVPQEYSSIECTRFYFSTKLLSGKYYNVGMDARGKVLPIDCYVAGPSISTNGIYLSFVPHEMHEEWLMQTDETKWIGDNFDLFGTNSDLYGVGAYIKSTNTTYAPAPQYMAALQKTSMLYVVVPSNSSLLDKPYVVATIDYTLNMGDIII